MKLSIVPATVVISALLATADAFAAPSAAAPVTQTVSTPPPVWAGLVAAAAWPLVVIIALVLLHQPLGEFLRSVGGRATKLSLFQVAVELSPAPEFHTPAAIASSIRDAEFLVMNSDSSRLLFQNIEVTAPGQYLTIDIGNAAKLRWLTSRLYIFTVMLERMRGVRCVVFVERTNSEQRSYLGYALSSEIRWRLAMKYPWLEQQYADAYANATKEQAWDPSRPSQDFAITSTTGKMSIGHANLVVTKYLSQLQQSAPPADHPNQWVCLHQTAQAGHGSVWEHAKWLDRERLQRVLDTSLHDESVSASPDVEPEELVRQILRRPGPFVAKVTDSRRLTNLIDRNDVLEKLAAHDLSAV